MNNYPAAPKRHKGHRPALSPEQAAKVLAPPPQAPKALKPKPRRKRSKKWLFLLPVGLVLTVLFSVLVGLFALRMAYSNQILPQVWVGNVALGGYSQAEAANALSAQWTLLTLRDGQRTWNVDPALLGITLDANATAANALAEGQRGLQGLFTRVDIAPVLQFDETTLVQALIQLSDNIGINIPAVNAGVAFENGRVVATPPQNGRGLDVLATVTNLQNNPDALASGSLTLVMLDVAPAISDSSALVAQAEMLLANPLDMRIFDPVTGDSVIWSVLPQQWGTWLTVESDPNSPLGLSLQAGTAQIEAYLQAEAQRVFDASRTLDFASAAYDVQLAIARQETPTLTVQHLLRTHTVRSGESITSIAWDYGIPYLYIQQANGGVTSLAVGQQITIPPADMFLEAPINPNKRIVVSISEQRTRVYENGQLKWDWVASTGISDSPTWTGVYQVLSHEPNAYAANWDLWMPNFMGVYQPVPNSAFTNGFHGYPTRGGGQLLWENSLGRRVTYGCILLSNTNVQLLYNWAETGVIVEIRP